MSSCPYHDLFAAAVVLADETSHWTLHSEEACSRSGSHEGPPVGQAVPATSPTTQPWPDPRTPMNPPTTPTPGARKALVQLGAGAPEEKLRAPAHWELGRPKRSSGRLHRGGRDTAGGRGFGIDCNILGRTGKL